MYIPVAGFLATLFFLPKMPADNPIVTTVVSSPVLLIGFVLVLVVVMLRCVYLVLHSDYGKQRNVR